MRTIKVEYKVYTFDELSESAKQKAIESLYDINIHDDWYESTYEDAKEIGCKIISFDTDRGSCCEMQIGYEDTVIQAILKNHGETCETYKIAKEYENKILDSDGNIDSDVAQDFKQELEEEYLSILRREFEYLTSEECIVETILANEYEFTDKGKLA